MATETELLATSRAELRTRQVVDIDHYLRVRTPGNFTQELFYRPEYVLVTKQELSALLDALDRLDPPTSGNAYLGATPTGEEER